MYSFVIQDWTSPRIALGVPTLTQSECDWMSFQAYQDIVFYTEVRALDRGGADDVIIAFQTSPSKDESMFKDMAVLPMASGAGLTTVTKVILSTNPDVPLARWVRWQMRLDGVAGFDYSATFRVLCAANAVGPL